ncbi:hypothetical protein P8452_51373 [Trifolium repens]|nr:hypothetical protein P8452_51373 [Trifolium repens]
MRNAECQLAMNVLWTRLSETGKDWRYVYKVLTRELAEDGYSCQQRIWFEKGKRRMSWKIDYKGQKGKELNISGTGEECGYAWENRITMSKQAV